MKVVAMTSSERELTTQDLFDLSIRCLHIHFKNGIGFQHCPPVSYGQALRIERASATLAQKLNAPPTTVKQASERHMSRIGVLEVADRILFDYRHTDFQRYHHACQHCAPYGRHPRCLATPGGQICDQPLN